MSLIGIHAYAEATARSATADRPWRERLMTQRVPLERWSDASNRQPADVHTVLACPTETTAECPYFREDERWPHALKTMP
jgi:hypothetical protein